MNKEEMFKSLSDKDKKEVLALMSFMKKVKEQDRKKSLYATYEEYSDILHISENLSIENEQLQDKLDQANNKIEKIKEYADDKREEFNEVIRYYLDDNLIGNEDEVNKLREFRGLFMELLSIIDGGDE